MKRAVYLDRDGVINKAIVRSGRPYPPQSLDKLEILEGVPESIRLLHDAGFFLSVISNQPDVARGKIAIEEVQSINQHLLSTLKIDEIKVCYHDDVDNCNCRKPRPGLILESALLNLISLNDSYFVGDRWRDIEAGQAAGCKTIFIDYDYKEKKPQHYDYRVMSLREASKIILGEINGL